jgi:hypothetical protein
MVKKGVGHESGLGLDLPIAGLLPQLLSTVRTTPQVVLSVEASSPEVGGDEGEAAAGVGADFTTGER